MISYHVLLSYACIASPTGALNSVIIDFRLWYSLTFS